MAPDTATRSVAKIMTGFARDTGLDPERFPPARYLWTDAFAVCNYLGLFETTGDPLWRDLAIRLTGQVHHVLGKHRDGQARTGWISGLPEAEGELHPTRGGLRIGKMLDERRPEEPYDERLEWDRDGQYYHYLTKWMHALGRVSGVTGNPMYRIWAVELAQAAHKAFTYRSPSGRKRMYWKMSIDLTRPLVGSMGQHDPLDGFVTYSELRAGPGTPADPRPPVLAAEIADMKTICRGSSWATDDPLGIGGLLADASRIAQILIAGGMRGPGLLEQVVSSALLGVEAFAESGTLQLPAEYRLAFRELGLAIGLAGAGDLLRWMEESPEIFGRNEPLREQMEYLVAYIPLGDAINRFWTGERNQRSGTWTGHREINRVMLATSLAPEGFLRI
jgi:hypothetical protein